MFCDFETLSASWLTQKRYLLAKMGQLAAFQLLSGRPRELLICSGRVWHCPQKIARPLAEGLKNEVVCREDRITRIIPQKLLNVREAIHSALSQVESHLVETNWTMAGPMPGDPDWSGGTVFRDEREVAIAAPVRAVFRAVCRLRD